MKYVGKDLGYSACIAAAKVVQLVELHTWNFKISGSNPALHGNVRKFPMCGGQSALGLLLLNVYSLFSLYGYLGCVELR